MERASLERQAHFLGQREQLIIVADTLPQQQPDARIFAHFLTLTRTY